MKAGLDLLLNNLSTDQIYTLECDNGLCIKAANNSEGMTVGLNDGLYFKVTEDNHLTVKIDNNWLEAKKLDSNVFGAPVHLLSTRPEDQDLIWDGLSTVIEGVFTQLNSGELHLYGSNGSAPFLTSAPAGGDDGHKWKFKKIGYGGG